MSGHVEVQETRLFATNQGIEWWTFFFDQAQKSGRVETVAQTPQGGLYRIACDDREHAVWLRDHMIANGLPAAAVKAAAS